MPKNPYLEESVEIVEPATITTIPIDLLPFMDQWERFVNAVVLTDPPNLIIPPNPLSSDN